MQIYFKLANHKLQLFIILQGGCFENEDLRKRRPKMGLRNYENEDPLRKRRPIFVFVITKTKTHYENEDPSLFSYYENEDPLRKRRPTTKTKTHLCFRTTKIS